MVVPVKLIRLRYVQRWMVRSKSSVWIAEQGSINLVCNFSRLIEDWRHTFQFQKIQEFNIVLEGFISRSGVHGHIRFFANDINLIGFP